MEALYPFPSVRVPWTMFVDTFVWFGHWLNRCSLLGNFMASAIDFANVIKPVNYKLPQL
jgi:hypothetical protein